MILNYDKEVIKYKLYLPSLIVPWSAAWPLGKIVLTKIPIFPLGESRPPTTLNPRPFFPGPFSNATVWRVHCWSELSEPLWGQFHQHFTRCVCMLRSQKCKKDWHIYCIFVLFGSVSVKALHKPLVKLTPGLQRPASGLLRTKHCLIGNHLMLMTVVVVVAAAVVGTACSWLERRMSVDGIRRPPVTSWTSTEIRLRLIVLRDSEVEDLRSNSFFNLINQGNFYSRKCIANALAYLLTK